MPETSYGPVMLDVEGVELTATDRERLAHPQVGGVILFARNYVEPRQLHALTRAIRGARSGPLLIAVDHEGGRVQRFRDGFTEIPSMRTLGARWNEDPAAAVSEAQARGRTIAAELGARDIDFSFTPVLDLDHGTSDVIGDRAFHRDPRAVGELAAALCAGLADEGMAAVGKHFPGHGYVVADSHHETPVDSRGLDILTREDVAPFAVLIDAGLPAIMPAHVVYPAVDDVPAGFSARWLGEILRGRLRFDGLIFSDDLTMAGAQGAGDIVARADAATHAGCDMVLVCNDPASAERLLDAWSAPANRERHRRAMRMARRSVA